MLVEEADPEDPTIKMIGFMSTWTQLLVLKKMLLVKLRRVED